MELQWPLILFTSLLAWSAGLFAALCLYALKGAGKKAIMPAWIASAVLLVAAGVAVVMHLEHWERIFNGFGHITSGITQELIGIVLMAVIAVVFLVMYKRNGGKVPAWVCIAGIVVALALMFVSGLSYKMASRPAWNSLLEVCTLVGAAVALGPLTMMAIDAVTDSEKKVAAWEWIVAVVGTVINAVCTVAYLLSMKAATAGINSVGYYFDNSNPTMGLVDPAATAPFAGGSAALSVVAIICAVIGVIAALAAKKVKPQIICLVGVLAVFVGAICLRVVFYQMGLSIYTLY